MVYTICKRISKETIYSENIFYSNKQYFGQQEILTAKSTLGLSRRPRVACYDAAYLVNLPIALSIPGVES